MCLSARCLKSLIHSQGDLKEWWGQGLYFSLLPSLEVPYKKVLFLFKLVRKANKLWQSAQQVSVCRLPECNPLILGLVGERSSNHFVYRMDCPHRLARGTGKLEAS